MSYERVPFESRPTPPRVTQGTLSTQIFLELQTAAMGRWQQEMATYTQRKAAHEAREDQRALEWEEENRKAREKKGKGKLSVVEDTMDALPPLGGRDDDTGGDSDASVHSNVRRVDIVRLWLIVMTHST
jgi:hypothetical protein